ncbi:MAG: acyl-CoA desaturase [Mycobacteriaceae bacterium]
MTEVNSLEKTGLTIEKQLAALTVGLPTVGAGAALWRASRHGVSAFDIAAFSAMYAITSLGVEAGMHRYFSHKSFTATPPVKTFLAISGSMAAQGPITFWVSTHRQHHAFADRDGDPHSPQPFDKTLSGRLKGLWHGHVGWLFGSHQPNLIKYGKDVIDDRGLMTLNQHYFTWIVLGLALPAAAGGLIKHSAQGVIDGLLWGGLLRIFILDHATWAVNSLGHTIGKRETDTRDNSRNIATLAPLTVGGSWHNNHHARPSLATTARHRWQLDISGLFITALEKLKLVSDVKRAKIEGVAKNVA